MVSKQRKKEIIKLSNFYADMCAREGSSAAMHRFWNDFYNRLFDAVEQQVIMYITQAYIQCKAGLISREATQEKQKRLLSVLD